ncbi:C40 family peptidase [Bacillus cereus group sp. BfR-BA-01309]|uniref:C40 family peptidase n=1 Tax=Bacillus cereus group sp. BfR-BA-01309 TaxID=2920286 RepID=UPI001F55EBD5|nr:C40 family peptidase [Bacillus cereus group sp. BfR-BA-01309]
MLGSGGSLASADEIGSVFQKGNTIQTISASTTRSITASQFNKVYAEMKKHEGKPYKYGGNSPKTGFDGSGLMQWGYGTQGIKLPRTSQDQYNQTTRVERKALQPGDLVFFKGTVPGKSGITHVGMYIGNNKFYNASNSGIGEDSLDSTYWSKYIAGYGRVK